MNLQLALFFAFTCIVARAGLNIVDRRLFGYQRRPLFETSFINSVVSFLIVLPIAILLARNTPWKSMLLSPSMIGMSIMMQAVSFAFSTALRSLEARRVTIVNKVADLIIPMVVGGSWGFPLATVACFIPAALQQPGIVRAVLSRQGFTIVILLVLQSVVMNFCGWKLTTGGSFGELWWFLAVTLFWRSVLCLVCHLLTSRGGSIQWRSSPVRDLFGRGLLMAVNHAAFIAALAGKHDAEAWAIINSAGLFTAIFGAYFLGEILTRTEWLGFFGLCLLALAKAWV